MLVPHNANKKDSLSGVVELNTELAAITFDLTQQNKRFAVFGGDHSCAIGTLEWRRGCASTTTAKWRIRLNLDRCAHG